MFSEKLALVLGSPAAHFSEPESLIIADASRWLSEDCCPRATHSKKSDHPLRWLFVSFRTIGEPNLERVIAKGTMKPELGDRAEVSRRCHDMQNGSSIL
ncbi:MAG: hypothetical protein ACR2QJ_04910 [Geminicoccaceae bacterium]